MLETLTLIATTILAFVYVSLNLATSRFGMNLSELNGSGKKAMELPSHSNHRRANRWDFMIPT